MIQYLDRLQWIDLKAQHAMHGYIAPDKLDLITWLLILPSIALIVYGMILVYRIICK